MTIPPPNNVISKQEPQNPQVPKQPDVTKKIERITTPFFQDLPTATPESNSSSLISRLTSSPSTIYQDPKVACDDPVFEWPSNSPIISESDLLSVNWPELDPILRSDRSEPNSLLEPVSQVPQIEITADLEPLPLDFDLHASVDALPADLEAFYLDAKEKAWDSGNEIQIFFGPLLTDLIENPKNSDKTRVVFLSSLNNADEISSNLVEEYLLKLGLSTPTQRLDIARRFREWIKNQGASPSRKRKDSPSTAPEENAKKAKKISIECNNNSPTPPKIALRKSNLTPLPENFNLDAHVETLPDHLKKIYSNAKEKASIFKKETDKIFKLLFTSLIDDPGLSNRDRSVLCKGESSLYLADLIGSYLRGVELSSRDQRNAMAVNFRKALNLEVSTPMSQLEVPAPTPQKTAPKKFRLAPLPQNFDLDAHVEALPDQLKIIYSNAKEKASVFGEKRDILFKPLFTSIIDDPDLFNKDRPVFPGKKINHRLATLIGKYLKGLDLSSKDQRNTMALRFRQALNLPVHGIYS